MNRLLLILVFTFFISANLMALDSSWIRINQLGYLPKGSKVAVFGSKLNNTISSFQLINATTNKVVFQASAGKNFGSYGPFKSTYRLNFSVVAQPGRYYLKAGSIVSPVFKIDSSVYDGTADFCLQYMRQQRSGFNPFLMIVATRMMAIHCMALLQALKTVPSLMQVGGGMMPVIICNTAVPLPMQHFIY